MSNDNSIRLVIEFGGGAELLFGNIKKHKASLAADKYTHWTIRKLLLWIKDNLLKERPELFIQDESVRPGILVLINDADWELLRSLVGKKLAQEIGVPIFVACSPLPDFSIIEKPVKFPAQTENCSCHLPQSIKKV